MINSVRIRGKKIMYTHNGRVIEPNKTWTSDDGYKHPSNWSKIWSAAALETWSVIEADDPVVKSFDNRFYWDADTPKSLVDVEEKDADGNNLKDVDGNIFIDFAGGIGTMNVGHSHPEILKRIKSQLDKYSHTCFSVAPYESYIELAERLSELVPISGAPKAAFFNSGAEAVENAIKISRSFSKRTGV